MNWDLQEAVTYYKRQGAPGDQTAIISFLREMQDHCGGAIPPAMLPEAAQALGTKEGLLLALVKRIPSLRLGGSHVLELCSGPNCGKHTALAALAEKLQKESGGAFSIKFVPCMWLCGKGPNLRWDGQLHHKADEALLRKLTAQK